MNLDKQNNKLNIDEETNEFESLAENSKKIEEKIQNKPIKELIFEKINILKKNINYEKINLDFESFLENDSIYNFLKTLKMFILKKSTKIFDIKEDKEQEQKLLAFLIYLWENFSWLSQKKDKFVLNKDDHKSLTYIMNQISYLFQVTIYKEIGLKKVLELDSKEDYEIFFNDLVYINNNLSFNDYNSFKKIKSDIFKNNFFVNQVIKYSVLFNANNENNFETINVILSKFSRDDFKCKKIEKLNWDFYKKFIQLNSKDNLNFLFSFLSTEYNYINFNKIINDKNEIIKERVWESLYFSFAYYSFISNKSLIKENEQTIINEFPYLLFSLYTMIFDYFIFEKITYKPLKEPKQWLIFGAPGTGKSTKIKKILEAYDEDPNIYIEYKRLTFHACTSYFNFVGSYKPITTKDGKTSYKYMPGEFSKMLANAYKDPNTNYVLIIEELNRGDGANAFGEFFQSLDRNKYGNSVYPISISYDLINYFLEEEKINYLNTNLNKEEPLINRISKKEWEIKLPTNLYIWATMNNADPLAKPIDPAFKRRWSLEYMDYNTTPKNVNIYWNTFRQNINNLLIKIKVPEDRLLGYWYIYDYIDLNSSEEQVKEAVKNKVIPYLFNDILKLRKEILSFNEYDFSTISLIRENFENWWNKYKAPAKNNLNTNNKKSGNFN